MPYRRRSIHRRKDDKTPSVMSLPGQYCTDFCRLLVEAWSELGAIAQIQGAISRQRQSEFDWQH